MLPQREHKHQEPSRGLLWAFTAFCLLLFAVHFGMTIAYTAPAAAVPGSLRAVAEGYMEPAFYQGWSLFAPDMQKGYTRFEYRNPPGRGEWVATETIGELSHPKIREISFKVNHYLEYELATNLTFNSEGRPQTSLIAASGYYKMAAYLCRAHAQLLQGEVMADSIEIRVLRTQIALPGEGFIASRDTIVFPPFSVAIGSDENPGH